MDILNTPYQLIVLLFLLGLATLLVVIGTSFLKMAIVLSILRNALGIQQIPPNIAIYALALILTFFIMAPVLLTVQQNYEAEPIDWNSKTLHYEVERVALSPYKNFIEQNTQNKQKKFFTDLGSKIWPQELQENIPDDSLVILIPAFAVSQIVEAFKIGFLLYLPFIAIDLIVSNILLAMGMMMVSPITISLPFKLMIFILVSGWEKLLNQLVLSYV